MIAGLITKGKFDIYLNKQGKLVIDKETLNNSFIVTDSDKVSLDSSEIPFIRYKYNQMSEEEFSYIRKISQILPNTVPIIEIDTSNFLLESHVDNINELKKYPVLLKICVNDSDLTKLIPEIMSLLNVFKSVFRIALEDKTSSLLKRDILEFTKQLEFNTNIDESMIAICNSPLTTISNCCLTAGVLRGLASKYGTKDTAISTLYHQMAVDVESKICFCPRQIEIIHDLVYQGEISNSGEKVLKIKKASYTPPPNKFF